MLLIVKFKKFRKFTEVSEKIGVKDFSLGAISPLTGEKLSKRKVVSYMGARVLPARGSIMSIFKKKFSNVSRFCALLMTSLILGELGEPKIGPLCCFSV